MNWVHSPFGYVNLDNVQQHITRKDITEGEWQGFKSAMLQHRYFISPQGFHKLSSILKLTNRFLIGV